MKIESVALGNRNAKLCDEVPAHTAPLPKKKELGDTLLFHTAPRPATWPL